MNGRADVPGKERLPNDNALGVVFGLIAVALALYLVIRTLA
jgi:hypothetical protein